MSPPVEISLAIVVNTENLSREARLLRPDQVEENLAGLSLVWMDEERLDDMVIITPRLCFG
jgi:hypothetical protein